MSVKAQRKINKILKRKILLVSAHLKLNNLIFRGREKDNPWRYLIFQQSLKESSFSSDYIWKLSLWSSQQAKCLWPRVLREFSWSILHQDKVFKKQFPGLCTGRDAHASSPRSENRWFRGRQSNKVQDNLEIDND